MSKNRERAEGWINQWLTSAFHHTKNETCDSLTALLDDVERERDEQWRLGLSAPQSGLVPGRVLDHVKAALDRAKAEGYEEAREQAIELAFNHECAVVEECYCPYAVEEAICAMKPGRRG